MQFGAIFAEWMVLHTWQSPCLKLSVSLATQHYLWPSVWSLQLVQEEMPPHAGHALPQGCSCKTQLHLQGQFCSQTPKASMRTPPPRTACSRSQHPLALGEASERPLCKHELSVGFCAPLTASAGIRIPDAQQHCCSPAPWTRRHRQPWRWHFGC